MTDYNHLPIFRNAIPQMVHIAKMNHGLKICVQFAHADKNLVEITNLAAKTEEQIVSEILSTCEKYLDERVAHFSQNRSATKHRKLDDLSPILHIVLEERADQ